MRSLNPERDLRLMPRAPMRQDYRGDLEVNDLWQRQLLSGRSHVAQSPSPRVIVQQEHIPSSLTDESIEQQRQRLKSAYQRERQYGPQREARLLARQQKEEQLAIKREARLRTRQQREAIEAAERAALGEQRLREEQARYQEIVREQWEKRNESIPLVRGWMRFERWEF